MDLSALESLADIASVMRLAEDEVAPFLATPMSFLEKREIRRKSKRRSVWVLRNYRIKAGLQALTGALDI